MATHQHTIQLAYDLLTGRDDPDIRVILENVIFLLWPTQNPDGQSMVAEWYPSNVGIPFETAPLPGSNRCTWDTTTTGTPTC